VALNDSHILFSGAYVPTTFILDWTRQQFVTFDEMPIRYSSATCGLLNNAFIGPEVLLARGDNLADAFSLTDLSWRLGRRAPENIIFATGVQADNGILSMGGYVQGDLRTAVDTIYKFDDVAYEWELLDVQLGQAVWGLHCH